MDKTAPKSNLISFLVILDAHSKWIEVFPTFNITLHFTLSVLHATFAKICIARDTGICNARHFSSKEFEQFLEKYNIVCLSIYNIYTKIGGLLQQIFK